MRALHPGHRHKCRTRQPGLDSCVTVLGLGSLNSWDLSCECRCFPSVTVIQNITSVLGTALVRMTPCVSPTFSPCSLLSGSFWWSVTHTSLYHPSLSSQAYNTPVCWSLHTESPGGGWHLGTVTPTAPLIIFINASPSLEQARPLCALSLLEFCLAAGRLVLGWLC